MSNEPECSATKLDSQSMALPPEDSLQDSVDAPLATSNSASNHETSPSVDTNARLPTEDIHRNPTPASLLLSTMLSLTVVLVLLIALRLMLPSLLEFSRYSWHRGQLRAEYELAGHQLERVSLEGISSVSQTVARRVCPSVVHITLDKSNAEVTAEDIIRPDKSRRGLVGQGSGVIVDPRGFVLTNFHVISDEAGKYNASSRINVTISDERVFRGDLVGSDPATDLAVIKIKADDLMPITWGDSECIDVGSPVWAVGSPFGLTGTITFGILSSKHRLDLTGTKYDERRSRQRFLDEPQFNPHLHPRYSDLMQSDVAVNPGNSGGPLVNAKGELIGINTAIIGTAYQGVSFSIPSKIVQTVFNQILETGKMRRGWLGVELVKVSEWKKQLAREADEEWEETEPVDGMPARGAVVRKIVGSDAPAAIAGMKIGDLITAMDGQPVKGVEDLIFAIGNSPVGSTIEFTIERDAATVTVKVIIGERPNVQ